MEFIWHDGGRAASGFVGLAGDCVTRAIAIATGLAYREVYAELGGQAGVSARDGVVSEVWSTFLSGRGWKQSWGPIARPSDIPRGVVIVDFEAKSQRGRGHLACVIDHTVYDTWNPFEDWDYVIRGLWTYEQVGADVTLPIVAPARNAASNENQLTQQEYERILKRVRALHRTASNHASTEGEIRNALRAMQSLMLTHNLSRRDIVEEEEVRDMGMTRRACPLNGTRTCSWERSLANYLVGEIFPTVQFYIDRRAKRTMFWFYGPVEDVQQSLGLFREMLLTIATAARVQYGGYARGSGASYAEGYVRGLPRAAETDPIGQRSDAPSNGALLPLRMLTVRSTADAWLYTECGIRLQSSTYYGRAQFDLVAHLHGRRDGARHDRPQPHGRKQIPHHGGS